MSQAAASGNQKAVGQSCTPVNPKGLVSSWTTQPRQPNISRALARPGSRIAST